MPFCVVLAQPIDRTKPPETPPLPSFKLPSVFETTLANGLQVVIVEDNRFPLVTVRLAFNAGSKFEPAGQPGLAEAVAALLTEGTKSRASRQIAEEIASLGGSLNASASPDTLIIAGNSLSEHSARLLDLVADIARDAAFPAGEIQLYQQNRKQTLLDQRSQSEFLAEEKLAQVVFGAHPYSRLSPTEESIGKLTAGALAGFRDAYLVPNNAVLILLGKLPPRAEALRTLEARFGTWARKELPALRMPMPPQPKRSITLVDRPGSVQADIHIGRLGVTRIDNDYFPLAVGNTILGGGTSSRLFNEIREKKGYAYSVYSHQAPRRDAGLFSTVMQVRNEVAGDAISGMLAEMTRIAKEPVSAAELTDVKNFLSGTFVMGLERQEGLAGQLVTIKTMGLPNDHLEKYTARIRSVQPAQILLGAGKVVSPDDAAVVVVGDAKQLRPALEKFGVVTVVPSK
ncbi:MAG: insulinase family protein [Candidatus Solibacter usitatus]|nr:insulinase family protein [Candidatus Solibacter usitatus]